jgi:hypothetical protein
VNQTQADLFHKLCEDPSVCNANAYFYARDGEGTPGIDWMCRRDLAARTDGRGDASQP